MRRAAAMHDASAYCAEQLRRFDRDRYLTALFAWPERRRDLFALYAFNLEIARAREMVREPIIGRLRLQWWRDTIEDIYRGSVRRHSVAEALARAIARRDLSRASLDSLIDAREADMADEPPEDLSALIAYAEATSATVVLLALAVLDENGEARMPPARTAALRIGTAWSLIGLLRAVPFHARSRRLYLPQTLLAEAGIGVHQIADRRPASSGLTTIVEAVASEAAKQLAEGSAAARGLPRHLLPALLPAVLSRIYLRRLRGAGYDPFDPRVQESPPGRIWRLALAMIGGRL